MRFIRSHILVCSGSNCQLRGSLQIMRVLESELIRKGLYQEIRVVETGCLGLCEQGPGMVVYPEGVMYTRVTPADIPEIVEEHLLKGRFVRRLMTQPAGSDGEITPLNMSPFFIKQKRVVLKNCGLIDPESIEEYIATGGYQSLAVALDQYSPDKVIDIVKASNLRGRGGAGFPTGRKWEFTRRAEGEQKYIICNADEGEPGTFKDRLIIEGDPHLVLEGMALAAYAIGADKGIVYVRGEYDLSIKRLEQAIAQARSAGLLGRNILGSTFSFDIDVCLGAGAYVCGEETALIESIEGKRGEPRLKPPYPAQHGLWGKPTSVNNVETLANIPSIIENGAEWFRSIGTANSSGTKVFTLTGNVVNAGLIEVPMGITLREIIMEIGGGIPGGRSFKMAQTGGTSGGCLAEDHLDVPMDYDSLSQYGSSLGSGALLIMDDSHCIVDLTKCFLRFFVHESCGQCTPCREGTSQLYHLVDKISKGRASSADIALIQKLSRTMQISPLCALGQTAPIPVLSAFEYFGSEVKAHLRGNCPANICNMKGALAHEVS
ncbi:MAG TPA: NADH-quinone oxidoreductase subunit NuoF [Bacillota bacterium]|nr:NADH-quinone oxidoreductase subunit NuoF [Bacillota bacterium]